MSILNENKEIATFVCLFHFRIKFFYACIYWLSFLNLDVAFFIYSEFFLFRDDAWHDADKDNLSTISIGGELYAG